MDQGHWTPELPLDFWQRNAVETPDREAVSDGAVRLTWAEGIQAVDRLAAALLEHGLAKDDVVLVQAGNSVPLMVLRLACEKTGILLTWLHFGFRRREIEHIIEVTRPVGAVIPADRGRFDFIGLYEDLQASRPAFARLFVIDGGEGAQLPSIAKLMNRPAPAEGQRPDLAAGRFRPHEYTSIVTSSGTTGLPKCIENMAWPRLAAGRVYIERMKMTADDRVASLIPLYTGGADLSYHTAPQIGARQILLPSFSAQAACRLIERERPTGVILVPTMLGRILACPDLARVDTESVRFITCGGGVLSYDMGRRAEDRFGAHIIQGYGLMDFGALTSHRIDDPREKRLNTNGTPLDGTEVRLLDAGGEPVPPGELGEICARGPYCVGGYLADDAATRDAWRDGYFHTGDLGRLDADGHITLEGRTKDIIIRGGQNISATEIEQVLVRHPAVREAAVVKMPDDDLLERVCAFVVPAGEAKPTLDGLTGFMNDQGIARFKFPERLELIGALPLTPGGNKVDKKVLEDLAARPAAGPAPD